MFAQRIPCVNPSYSIESLRLYVVGVKIGSILQMRKLRLREHPPSQ